jgi:hypothetical protein
VLTLVVEGAHAPMMQHVAPVIVERVNRFFGYPAVERVAVQARRGSGRQGQGARRAAFASADPGRISATACARSPIRSFARCSKRLRGASRQAKGAGTGADDDDPDRRQIEEVKNEAFLTGTGARPGAAPGRLRRRAAAGGCALPRRARSRPSPRPMAATGRRRRLETPRRLRDGQSQRAGEVVEFASLTCGVCAASPRRASPSSSINM